MAGGRKKYTRQQIRRNRIIVMSVLCVLITLLCWGIVSGIKKIISAKPDTQPSDGAAYTEIGPEPADENSTVTGAAAAYDFSAPVPQSDAAADSWFADALFVGGTHMAGMVYYGDPLIAQATVLYNTGCSVRSGVDASFTDSVTGESTTLAAALASGKYQKIYLLFGLNELGWGDSYSFYTSYTTFAREVAAAAPGCQLYLCTVLPVTASENADSDSFNNARVVEYNGYIQKICKENEYLCLNLYEAYADSSGNLPEEISGDGSNIEYGNYEPMKEYFYTHTAGSLIHT